MAGPALPSPPRIQHPPAPAVRGRAARPSAASLLSVVDKKGRLVGRLSPGDETAMLAAFAYSGATAEARTRGTDVVRAAQQRDCWFQCDCLGVGEPAPVLVPVTETHIRRSPHHPAHADGCPFEMNAAEREGYAASLRELQPGECFQLARAIGQPGAAPVRDTGAGHDADDGEDEDGEGAGRGVRTAHRQRSKLSQLLFKLLSDTRLHQVGRGPRGHADQQAAIYKAARGISLGGELMLSGLLYTDPGQLDALLSQVRGRARWPKGRRPHGVLVFIAARIEAEVIVAVSGTRLTIEGPITVFGPGHGDNRTGPFVVAVLVASPDGRAPFVPLKAYAHPCWTETDMLPLDSTNERRSLNILVRFASWMAKQGYAVEITKPLHDRSRYYMGGEEADQVVKPDFEGKVFAAEGRFARSFVVEVMGLSHALYRAKKQRLKTILTRKPGRYLEHQAHDGIDPDLGDRQFIKDLEGFGRAVMNAPAPKPTLTPAPPGFPLPPAPAPSPSLPPAPVPLRPVVAPASAKVSQWLFGSPTPQPNAASAVPAPTVSRRPPEPGGKLGQLKHRLLTMLGVKP